MAKDLTLRQLRFVEAYLANGGNATRAALAAGYAPKSSGERGSALTKVPAIAMLIRGAKRTATMTAADIRRRYEQIASGDLRLALTWGPDGVAITPSDELDDDTAMAVAGVREIRSKDGARAIELKMHDPKPALDALARIEKMTAPDGEVHLTQNTLHLTLNSMTREQLSALRVIWEDERLWPLRDVLSPLLQTGELLPQKAVEEAD